MASQANDQELISAKLLSTYKCINQFRLQKMFCDVRIKVGFETIHAHGGVLCAHSSYFKEVLRVIQGEKIVELPELELSIVKSCVDYMYTGEISISFGDIEKLIKTVQFLGISEVEKMCELFLLSHIDIERGMFIHETASKFGYNKVQKEAKAYLCKNFVDIAKSSIFLTYSKDQVTWLIRDKFLPRHSEERRVWFAVINWVKHDRDNREAFFPDLLRMVKLDNLTINFMNESIRSELMVMRSDTCMNFLLHHLFAIVACRSISGLKIRNSCYIFYLMSIVQEFLIFINYILKHRSWSFLKNSLLHPKSEKM